jgi:membrane protein required for colicin V production
MQTIDIVILVALVLPAIVGAVYGFLNIVFSLVAWAIALGVSLKFSPHFGPLFAEHVETPLLRDVLAFIAVFVIALMLLSIAGYFIVKLLGRTGLTSADRIFGFFFGIALGGAIIAVVVFLAGFTAMPRETWWEASMLVQPFERMGLWARGFLPENVAQYHSY